jgi:dienelactone hydrolase
MANVAAPSLGLALLELPRAMLELSALSATAPLLARAAQGDGHAVLVLPGFTASDRSTSLLRRYLKHLGYDAQGWDLGRNLGPKSIGHEGEVLAELVERMHRGRGEKISLIGQSLGGVMAREVAREFPDLVRQVITLGSPFGGNPRANNVWRIYERMTGDNIRSGDIEKRVARARVAPPVPTTAIFSKTDGIVAWESCVEVAGKQIDNIEIQGSHCGMSVHPAALYAIADRLAQADDSWKPFDRTGWRAGLYPRVGRIAH